MYCPKCQKELKEGAKFCNACGTKIEKGSLDSKDLNRNKVELERTEVLNMGKPPMRPEQPASVKPAAGLKKPVKAPKKKNKAKGPMIGLSIVAVILILGMGAMAAYRAGTFDSFLYKGEKVVTAEEETEETDTEPESSLAVEPESSITTEPTTEPTTEAATHAAEMPTTQAAVERQQEVVVANSNIMPTAAYTPTQANQATQATQLPTTAYTSYPVQEGDYILPDSNSRSLSANEVSGLTKEQLRLARNEIYARYGRKFNDEGVQEYFDSKAWYSGRINPGAFSDDTLSQIEKDNIKLIEQYEAVVR